MGIDFKEKSFANINIEKYSENYDEIDWKREYRLCGNCKYCFDNCVVKEDRPFEDWTCNNWEPQDDREG